MVFILEYYTFAEGRLHLVAERGLSDTIPQLFCQATSILYLLGIRNGMLIHLPVRFQDGKILGRGSSDMKGGLAAMILASIRLLKIHLPKVV